MDCQTKCEFTDVRINVPWGYVACRWYGNKQLRPILAIHGWQDNLGTWETLVPLLPQHIGVLCIDLPGHGLSSHLPRGMAYYFIDFVHIIVRIMEEYNWQKVSLMGHSMGSIIGFIFAALFPHKVDMLVSIDVIRSMQRDVNIELKFLSMHSERLLIEEEYLEAAVLKEPPSYSYDELEHLLCDGTFNSIHLENCKYILNRSITKSTKYPDKYYFSRDGRLKNYVDLFLTNEMLTLMGKRIINIPYLLLKGSESEYINEDLWDFIELQQNQNPQFEFYEVYGTHHVHLNNPQAVAALLNPFINHHRPVTLISWSLTEDAVSYADDKVPKPEENNKDTRANSKL